MDGEAWWATVHGVTNNQIRLSDKKKKKKKGFSGDSQTAQLVKNPPAMQETWVHSLGFEDPLEKGMATHSSIFPWKIPWT